MRERKYNLRKPFKPYCLWERLFNRFVRGDIVQIPLDSSGNKHNTIFYGTYRMSEEQIHVQTVAGWGKEEGTIILQEFLLYNETWKKVKLIRSCTRFQNLHRVMCYWEARRKWMLRMGVGWWKRKDGKKEI